MHSESVHDRVVELVEPFLEGMGLELVRLEYRSGGKGHIGIYIDKPGGITLEDCERVSRGISDLLDAYDPVPHSYVLEVSSPGVERPLHKRRDYERFRGEPVKVITVNPVDGSKKINGVIDAVSEDMVVLRMDDGSLVQIAFDNINKAHLRFTP